MESHQDGRWVFRPESLSFVWIPSGKYDMHSNIISQAYDKYEDRVVEVSTEKATSLFERMHEEGMIPDKYRGKEKGMEKIVHRLLDIQETQLESD